MLKFAADENFNNDIVRGVRRRNAALNIVRVQDEGLSGAVDPIVLEWAAQNGRLVLTHDVSTMTRYAYDRVRTGQPMPGIVEASRDVPIGKAIEDIVILAECSREGEWEGQIIRVVAQQGPISS
jgi:predicted nuclease of predicted toxin-antitoxin system